MPFTQSIREEANPSGLLTVYHQKWLVYLKAINYLSTLYIYLNSQYVRKYKFSNTDFASTDRLMEINELGAYLWKVEVIKPLKDDLIKLLLKAFKEYGVLVF